MKGGRAVAAIGISLRARLISQLITDRTGLPDDMTFYALDEKGQAAIHKDPDKMFLYPSDLGESSLKSAVATILSQPRGGVDYSFEGKARTAVFNKSDLTHWHFVLVRMHK
jgi:hypothetical protein